MISQDPQKILPHRDPFLWVHRLISKNDRSTQGVVEFDVKPQLEVFRGHFPGSPIFPGVLILEAAAQACGWIYLLDTPPSAGKSHEVLFAGISGFRFRKPVVPPMTLQFSCEQSKLVGDLHLWDVTVTDKKDGSRVAGGSLWMALVSRN